MRVLNAAQMRDADRQTIDEIGIPSMVLMENAGRQVVAALEAAYDDLSDRHVAVLCGPGNNGGDGFVVARTLHQRGVDVSVFVVATMAAIKGDARLNLEILGRLGLTVVEISDEHAWDLHFSEISQCDLIVDAIFGTGLKSPLAGMMETVAADVNASGIPVIAIDLPSGLSADHAEPIGECIHAAMTVTLAAPKLPLVLPPGEALAGNIVVADIGIPPEVIDNLAGPRLELLTREGMREILQPREADSHKGDYGHVLVIAGSRGKTGAAHLAAVGALRSGAGLVSVATPRSAQPIVAAMGAEYMTVALEETAEGTVAASGARDGSRPGAGRDRRRPGPRPRSRRHGVRPGTARKKREPARARCRCAERARVRSRSAAERRRANAARSSSRRIRARWRGWPIPRSTKCRQAGSTSLATSPSSIRSMSC